MAYFDISRLVLKWVVRPPPTGRYPFEPRTILPGSRGQLRFAKARCVFCGVCAKRCPTAALSVDRPAKQWALDRWRCITCGCCVEACPKDCLEFAGDHAPPAFAKDPETS
jgi:formate hydrogenlyase subunit 6/NADH:ubiquinone oxidoreductase subunit I